MAKVYTEIKMGKDDRQKRQKEKAQLVSMIPWLIQLLVFPLKVSTA
jgi:hypothetical protein